MKATYDYLIVGAGLFGAVFAHEATRRGKRCLVIDKRQHTGGNIYCKEVNGIQVHYYGAHIFHKIVMEEATQEIQCFCIRNFCQVDKGIAFSVFFTKKV